MDMKKRIALELRSRSPAEVSELVLDNCRSSDGDVDGLTEEWTGLELLSMGNIGLSSLSRLPPLPRLRKLELGGNGISGGLDVLSEKCPRLSHLNLSQNQIGDLSSVETLQSLKHLRSLNLSSCEVSSLKDYRESVFRLLPQLSFLDGLDQEDNEAPPPEDEDDDDEAGPHGSGDDDDDDDEEDDEEDEESSEGDEVGLSYLMKEGIQDEEDDGDYVEEEEEDEEEDGDEDGVQGEKRKREADDEGDDDDDDDE